MDIVERLPVPFGLVRFGVAPDHPEVKVGLSKLAFNCLEQNFTESLCVFYFVLLMTTSACSPGFYCQIY